MPVADSILDLGAAVDRIKQRTSNCYIIPHDTTTGEPAAPVCIGEVADTIFRFTPKVTRPTSTGKEHTYGFDVEITFQLLQTGDPELAAIPDLVDEHNGGTTFRFTDGPSTTGTDPGFVFERCGVSPEGEINLAGGESFITFTLKGSVDRNTLARLGTPLTAADVDVGGAYEGRGLVEGDRVITF